MITRAHSPLSIVQSRACSPLPLTAAPETLGPRGGGIGGALVPGVHHIGDVVLEGVPGGDLIVGNAVEVPGNRIDGSDTHEERLGPGCSTLHPDVIGRRDELGHGVPTQQLDVVGDHCTGRHLDRQRIAQVVLAKDGRVANDARPKL
ncbi:MAG: hypothetical protein GY925_07100 [Actinomycetia bacterium]|nr:hypothetical protein [Actinomycetes bacterium]